MKSRLDAFYAQYSDPQYDMWNGGGSQTRIHDGIDEEIAQQCARTATTADDGFEPADTSGPRRIHRRTGSRSAFGDASDDGLL